MFLKLHFKLCLYLSVDYVRNFLVCYQSFKRLKTWLLIFIKVFSAQNTVRFSGYVWRNAQQNPSDTLK